MRRVSRERIDEVKAGRDAGLTYDQIADGLGITRSAVAGIIYRHCKPSLDELLPADFEKLVIEHDAGTKTMLLGKMVETIEGGAIYRGRYADYDVLRRTSGRYERCRVIMETWGNETLRFENLDVRIKFSFGHTVPIVITRSAPPPVPVQVVPEEKRVLSRAEQEAALDDFEERIDALWAPFIARIEADIDAGLGRF